MDIQKKLLKIRKELGIVLDKNPTVKGSVTEYNPKHSESNKFNRANSGTYTSQFFIYQGADCFKVLEEFKNTQDDAFRKDQVVILQKDEKLEEYYVYQNRDFDNPIEFSSSDTLLTFLTSLMPEAEINTNNSFSSNQEFRPPQRDFNFHEFENAVQDSGLVFSSTLVQRFVASLQTKSFVILTGLAGSGKTKLAEAFSSWITNDRAAKQVFKQGQKLPSKQASYVVRHISDTNVTVESEGKSWAICPLELVEYWVDVITENSFNIDTDSQTIKEKVLERHEKTMTYSKTHNSFHSILKALALGYISSRGRVLKKITSNSQVCMVSVGADWTNREPLLGFPDALNHGKYVRPESGVLDLILAAQSDIENPYFLILDEMNMSHVERYFADFLSAMESVNSTISLHSGDKEWSDTPSQIALPKNLFIIGTVNVDETTYMFSPKVLDRANVIEFRVSEYEMSDYFDSLTKLNIKNLSEKGASMAQDFVSIALSETEKVDSLSLGDELMPFFNDLQKVGAEFGYRTASEINRFVDMYNRMSGVIDYDSAIDAAIAQKLLPKLHGSRNKLEKTLVILAKQCLHDTSREDVFTDVSKDDIKYKISYEKLKRMHKRIMTDGFTSFAEA